MRDRRHASRRTPGPAPIVAPSVLFGCLLVVACGAGDGSPQPADSAAREASTPASREGGTSAPGRAPIFDTRAVSSRGMVVSGSPWATEAGVRILEAGGNAVDAAVAAAFALAVAEPTQSGLGGRTQLLLRLADGRVRAIDGGTEVPLSYDRTTAPTGETGYAAVGIPGTVAALTSVHLAHGQMDLATVMAPAIEGAREGVTLPDGERRRLAALVEELGPESSVARLFGTASAPDSVLVQPALARTLRAIAEEGPGGFYGGNVARAMAADIQAGGGFVTETDLIRYRARDAPVASTRVAGFAVVGSYLPASGVTVAQILAILDRMRLPPDEAGWAMATARALVMGFQDRESAEAMDPAEATAWLTSDSLLSRRAEQLDAVLAADREATARSDAWSEETTGAAPVEHPFTTHVSVADDEGNVVALTQSLGPTGGARVATPALGFLYASTLGGYLTAGGPGYRPWSSQAPVLVVGDEGPRVVAGGAGARRIISALVSTLSRVLHRNMSLADAVAAPRLHPTGGRVYVEEGWSSLDSLQALGVDVEERERSYFARLNVIEARDGEWVGVAEPGWSGASAAGPR